MAAIEIVDLDAVVRVSARLLFAFSMRSVHAPKNRQEHSFVFSASRSMENGVPFSEHEALLGHGRLEDRNRMGVPVVRLVRDEMTTRFMSAESEDDSGRRLRVTLALIGGRRAAAARSALKGAR